jgi:hypothetical protein
MVIFQIHAVGVASLKKEGHPPVGPYGHGPKALAVALQRVQSKRRLVHILHLIGLIERRKDQPQTVNLIGADLATVVLFKLKSRLFSPFRRCCNYRFCENGLRCSCGAVGVYVPNGIGGAPGLTSDMEELSKSEVESSLTE